MKKIFLFLAAFGLGPIAMASRPPDIMIQTEFTYSSSSHKLESNREYILTGDGGDHGAWTTLIPPQQGIALIGKVKARNKKNVSMEILVIDTNQQSATGCSISLKADIGKPKVLSCEGTSIHMTINLAQNH